MPHRETLLTIARRREERDCTGVDLSNDAVDRYSWQDELQEALRTSQPCRFTVVRRGDETIPSQARLLSRPTNIEGAALLVVVTIKDSRKALFDAGRACQNMIRVA